MASIRQVFFKVCPLGQQLQRQYEFFATPSINLLNTAMIDCPVASIGSTSNKYLLLKSAIAWYSTLISKIIVIGWYLDADIKPF
jgi:hypothetical protein